jgi:DKNYY family
MRALVQHLHTGSQLMALSLVSAGAWASSCAPVTSGYLIGPPVSYFLEDRSAQAPRRQEHTLVGADPQSFQVVRHPMYETGPCASRRVEYGRDKQHVFHQWKVIRGADPQTYTFLDAHYARDKTAIYSLARRLTTRINAFQTLAGGYATDGRHHFYQDKVIKGRGFELLGAPAHSSLGYARTEHRVYHKGQVLAYADARSFELFKPEVGITRDKRAVYFDDQIIAGADPATFEQVHGYTFKDRGGVYTEGRRLGGINPASVRATEFGNYLVDDQSVFKAGQRLAGRDAATFAELQHPWSRDKLGAYYQDVAVPGVDLPSFKTTGLDRAEDRNYRYEGPRRACKFNADDPQALPVCVPGKTP